MEIVRIFDHQLYAFKYEGGQEDVFEQTFNNWADPSYLEDFFEKNKADLQNGYYGPITIEQAVERTINYADTLEQELLRLTGAGPGRSNNNLDSLFKPLDNFEYGDIELSRQKAYGIGLSNWLRLYALKTDPGCYLVTGSAIKLTRGMQTREHTTRELDTLERCRAFLLKKGIINIEGLEEEL